MMKLRAETLAQEGRMLEFQAHMREEQEAEEAFNLQSQQINEAEEAIVLQSQQIIRNNIVAVIDNSMDGLENPNNDRNKTKITHDIEEKQHSKIEHSIQKTCENLQVREAGCHQEGPSDHEDEQKVLMKKDLKTLIELVNENTISSVSIDPQIFKSSIFKEADKLITVNDHFPSLLKAVGQEINNQDDLTNEEDDIKTEFEKVKGAYVNLENTPLNLSKATLEIRDPNLNFSNEEINWVQQLDQNLQKSLKIFVRPEFFRAVINFRLAKISLREFSKVMLAGRPARTYCFLMIMSNLPYFKDLTTKYLLMNQIFMKSKLNFHF